MNDPLDIEAGFTITNDRSDEKITIPVVKKWAGGAEGGSATVILKRGDTQIGDAVTLSDENNWSYLFKDLDKYDSSGNEYEYTVEETDTEPGFISAVTRADADDTVKDITKGFIVTNTLNDEKIDIPVEKKWAEGVSGESVTVILKQDGTQLGDAVTLKEDSDSSNSWKHTFTDLDKYAKDGHEYTYTVEETNNNYKAIVTANDENDIEQGFTITNEQSDKKVNIPVTKKWAKGVKGDRAVIVLVRNGEKTDQKVTLTAAKKWKGSFRGLDKYDAEGNLIEYTVAEETATYKYNVKSDGKGGYIVTNYSEGPTDAGGPGPDSGKNGGSPLTGDTWTLLSGLIAAEAALLAAILIVSRKRRRG